MTWATELNRQISKLIWEKVWTGMATPCGNHFIALFGLGVVAPLWASFLKVHPPTRWSSGAAWPVPGRPHCWHSYSLHPHRWQLQGPNFGWKWSENGPNFQFYKPKFLKWWSVALQDICKRQLEIVTLRPYSASRNFSNKKRPFYQR